MTRKVFEIVLVILGLLLGTVANLHGNIIPTRVSIVSNEDTNIQIKVGGSQERDVTLGNLDVLPVHYDEEKKVFYNSPTLSMDDLEQNANGQYFQNSYEISLKKKIDNAYLAVEFIVEGEDAINPALRCKVKYLTEEHILKPNEQCIIRTDKISNKALTTIVNIWYELDDEAVTIDNINNAEGSQYKVNFYAYVEE